MRLLVLGANGQIGWELAHSLLALGEVIALDRTGCDLARPDMIPQVVHAAKPDVLVNAAAYTAVDRAEAEEELATVVNATAAGVLAGETQRAGALLVHYSTDYVFDGTKAEPYVEADPVAPLNAYGRSKLAGERAVRAAGGDHLILRTSWIYAARGRNFFKTILRLAREREELRIVADQVGAPTFARNVAEATTQVIEHAQRERDQGEFKSETLHMTAAGVTTWHGFAKAILNQAGNLAPSHPVVHAIRTDEFPTPARRPRNSRLRCDRLRERFGVALPEWEAGLAQCLADPCFANPPETIQP
jgi:dTDP-4-dehydrorhamnose reductase